jgi:hypothetical protein
MTITSYRGREGGHVDETLLAGEADPGYAATQEDSLAEADTLTGLPTGAIDLLEDELEGIDRLRTDGLWLPMSESTE